MPTTAAAGVSGGKKPLAALDSGALGYIQKLPGIGALAKSEEQGGLSEQTKLALLGGLGGMLASPNRTLLGALGSGITSGVETYQGMGGLGVQQKQAETQAQIGNANIDRIRQMISAGSLINKEGKWFVLVGKKGTPIEADRYFSLPDDQRPPTQGEAMSGADTGTAIGTEAPANTSKIPPYIPPKLNTLPEEEGRVPVPEDKTGSYDAQSRANAKTDRSTLMRFSANSNDPQGMAYKKAVNDQADLINNGAINTRELATQLLQASTNTGINTPGSGSMFRSAIVKLGNTLADMGGAKNSDGSPMRFGQLDSQSEIANKINILRQKGMGAEGIGMLMELNKATPNTDMRPETYLPILIDTLAQERRALDRQAHVNQWDLDSGGNFKFARDDFERANKDRYVKEGQVFKQMALDQNRVQLLIHMLQQHPDLKPELIDEQLGKLGIKKGSRYFYGGQ
jgi:hypothetical protein